VRNTVDAGLERTFFRERDDKEGGSPASYIPAPESFTTVAAFRPWRGLQTIVAGEPAGPP